MTKQVRVERKRMYVYVWSSPVGVFLSFQLLVGVNRPGKPVFSYPSRFGLEFKVPCVPK